MNDYHNNNFPLLSDSLTFFLLLELHGMWNIGGLNYLYVFGNLRPEIKNTEFVVKPDFKSQPLHLLDLGL